jgi:serine phosphatase RsbU (regulator of sigma subunit)
MREDGRIPPRSPGACAARPSAKVLPVTAPSYTSGDSFLLRAQRSEEQRSLLMMVVLGVIICSALARRVLGGEVMLADSVFFPTMAVLLAWLAYQAIVYARLRGAARTATIIPRWRWVAGAGVDLAVPVSLLAIVQWRSALGPIAALSVPGLLVLPLVILLSVLRLRPAFTLWTGLGAAAAHWALSTRALIVADAPAAEHPVVYSYGVMLALTGLGGAVVARSVRRHVVEASNEAAAREQTRLRLEGIERDLAVARDIQSGLLPAESPNFAGFDIAGMNRPADQTGGDYYDWQTLPDGRLAVVLADVTGHGIGPALVMAVCRAYARASAPSAPEPGALLRRLNELLVADLRGGRFITFALALLDPSGRVDLLSAGHGPTLLYHADTGEVEQFGGDGPPLGIALEERYEPTRTFTMRRGDLLVLLTDGFIEWARDGREQFGAARMADELKRRADRPAAEILRDLDGAVREFAAGAPQLDDTTAVVIKRT